MCDCSCCCLFMYSWSGRVFGMLDYGCTWYHRLLGNKTNLLSSLSNDQQLIRRRFRHNERFYVRRFYGPRRRLYHVFKITSAGINLNGATPQLHRKLVLSSILTIRNNHPRNLIAIHDFHLAQNNSHSQPQPLPILHSRLMRNFIRLRKYINDYSCGANI